MTSHTIDPAAAGQTEWSPWARRFGWVLMVGWVVVVAATFWAFGIATVLGAAWASVT